MDNHISLNIGEREEKKKMKIKSKTLPSDFRNFSVKYVKGGKLSNWGALRNLSREVSWQQAAPFFPINRGGGAISKCS